MKRLGLYVHIPFCSQKCSYCDFLSFEGQGNSPEIHEEYIKSLIREIGINGKSYREDYRIDSIFFGGGTPSLIQEALIADVLSAVKADFNVSDDAEITIESNPGTLNRQKLERYLAAGINRLSMGVQSLDEQCLIRLGRIHNRQDFLDNFRLAREVGFRNISVDLMFSIPGQDMEIWNDTLNDILQLAPEHISFYSLQIEEGTKFFRLFNEGELQENSDELDRGMYHEAIHLLKKRGYHHYEISNAAKPGLECRHNLKYWSMEDYLGVGLGSHSFVKGVRFSNTRNLAEYNRILAIDNQTLAENALPEVWRQPNTRQDMISEYLFTGLRKIDGISLSDFEERFGATLQEIYRDKWPDINRFIESKHLFMDENKLKFTEKGIDVSNTVLVEFV